MITAQIKTEEKRLECINAILPVKDALDILIGRWKLSILIALSFGNKRFKEISRDVQNITDKVLSKELKELETNQLITRTVYDTFPPMVEYAATEHGQSLFDVIVALIGFGFKQLSMFKANPQEISLMERCVVDNFLFQITSGQSHRGIKLNIFLFILKPGFEELNQRD